MALTTALIVVAIFAVGFGCSEIVHKYQADQKELRELREECQRLYDQNTALAEANPKRLPYLSLDEIEFTICALLRAKDQASLRLDFIDNALAHAQKARNPKGK